MENNNITLYRAAGTKDRNYNDNYNVLIIVLILWEEESPYHNYNHKDTEEQYQWKPFQNPSGFKELEHSWCEKALKLM